MSAGIEAISQEDGQLVVKSAALETADRVKLQGQLHGQNIPARVARRAIWLELRGEGAWQSDLVKTLETVRG